MDKELMEQIRQMQATVNKAAQGASATLTPEPEKPKLEAALKSAEEGFKFSDLWGIKPPAKLPDVAVSRLESVPHEVSNLIPPDEETYVPQGVNEFMFTKAMEANQRVLLTGPAGSGKSTLPKVYAARTGRPFLRVQCNASMEYEDLFGNLSVRGGAVVFDDGPLTQAARHGGLVCLDEVSTLRATAAMGLQWLLEQGGKIHLPAYPSENPDDKYVTPHPEFRLVMTDNTNLSGDETGRYVGTNVQNAAMKDRIDVFIKVTYMAEKSEMAMVAKHVPDLDAAVLKNMLKLAKEIRNGFEKASCECTISPRVLLRWAKDTVAFGDPGIALRYAFVNGLGADDEVIVSTVYSKVFGEKLPASLQA
jgi:cobaltochelatase CobS